MMFGILFCILVSLFPYRTIASYSLHSLSTRPWFNIFLHVGTTATFGVYSSDAITAVDFSGVYRLATHGTLTQLTRELRAPN